MQFGAVLGFEFGGDGQPLPAEVVFAFAEVRAELASIRRPGGSTSAVSNGTPGISGNVTLVIRS